MTEQQPRDRRVVQCNYTEATAIAAKGARAYVSLSNPGNGSDRIVVVVRSRGGRWVRKWEDIRVLGNFRAKTLPAEHHMYANDQVWSDDGAATTAAELAADLTEARRRETR